MRYVIGTMLALSGAIQAYGADAGGTIPEAVSATAKTVVAPIPLSVGWVEGFLLMIVWLFVVAILVGPMVGYFGLEPRAGQRFSDDKKVRL